LLEELTSVRSLSLCIITKSPLIARDVDVLAHIAAHASVTVHLSLITVDRALARRIEPRAPTPESRLRALKRLSDAGIAVGINIMPVLPGITDSPLGIEALVRAVAQAGAKSVHTCALRLQAAARERYLPILAEEFPELKDRYAKAYAKGYAVSDNYQKGLKQFVRRTCERVGIHYGSREDVAAQEAEPVSPAKQLELDLR
jgi:DNA repair photolyase